MLFLIDFGLSNEKAYPKIFSIWVRVKEIDATISHFNSICEFYVQKTRQIQNQIKSISFVDTT